jgi:hypothetical protein
MPTHSLGYRPSGGLDGEADISELDAFEAALHDPHSEAAEEAGALGHADQLARDTAAIERAIAALRRAEPALESWSQPRIDDALTIAARKPRPVWVLIGLLWLSTALATVGAVAAIAVLAG